MNPTDLHKLADHCPYDFALMVKNTNADFLGTGGNLDVSTLLHAYRCGVFPWFGADEPICWWSPLSRCVITPKDFIPKKSLQRTAKKCIWTLTTNHTFNNVIDACSQARAYSQETWIQPIIKESYQALHELGVAVSVEIWQGTPLGSPLIGGLYGVNVGRLFCGESMFHTQTDASKIAFWGLMTLCQQTGIELVDCQLENPHLMSLGARLLPKADFIKVLTLTHQPCTGLGNQKIQLPVYQLLQS